MIVNQFGKGAFLVVSNNKPFIVRQTSKDWILYRHDLDNSPTIRASSYDEAITLVITESTK